MSKLYNDRYVKNQPTKKTVDFTKPSSRGINNGKMVETIICVCIGSIVTCTLGSMCISAAKPFVATIEAIHTQNEFDVNMYNDILEMGVSQND